MKELLKDFKCKDYKELNKESAFKMMILNICNYRNEKYRYWKPGKGGFILITDKSFLEFEWKNKDYKCIVESDIYS